jgi:hypothetical protein
MQRLENACRNPYVRHRSKRLGFALISNMVFVSSANCANFSILGS